MFVTDLTLMVDSLSPTLLLLVVFAVAAMESAAVIGLLVPGVALLLALTLAAVESQVPLLWWWGAGALGAFTGDGLSFLLGRWLGPAVRHWSVFQRHPHWLADGERFFHRYGVASIALGRFVGPIRPIVPSVAGMLRMPASTFWWTNALSSPAWAGVYLVSMYWLGEQFADWINTPLLIGVVLVATLVAMLVSVLVKRRG